jgi:ferredoxin
MPWVDREKCTGCGICAQRCPAGAILMDAGKAEIRMRDCIRCGTCHSACPQEAVRHDSEKIPDNIRANVEMSKTFMDACVKHFGVEQEKWKCLERMIKHFNKEKIVAEKTMEKLVEMQRERPL